MPPPSPWAYGQKVPPPHKTPDGEGDVDWGAARLPVMRLSSIVTVAPMLPLADAGTSMPPPAVKEGAGFDVLTPPVIVTPLIVTVGSLGASASPIVTTGPPPLMIVVSTPAPINFRFLSIVIPPANVPEPMWMTSPSCAASTAAW